MPELPGADAALHDALVEALPDVAALYDTREFGKAVRDIMALADRVNHYADDNKPWELAKTPASARRLHEVCSTLHRAHSG